MRRHIILSFFAALLVGTIALCGASREASAQWVTQGAEILPSGKYAFDAKIGFPSTVFMFHIPVASSVEVNPFISLDYWGYGIGRYRHRFFGNTLGAQLKFRLWDGGNMGVGLLFDLGIAMSYLDHFNLAINIGGPQVKFHYILGSIPLALIASFKMPVQIWVIDGAFANIPMLFGFGIEYKVIEQLTLHTSFDVGPVIYAADGFSDVEAHANFFFGVSYLF